MNSIYPTIISFYTNTWEYPRYAKRMEKNCEKLGLSSHIVEIPDAGNWLANTRKKPQFILETLSELKTRVLWIDADGSIVKKPELLREGYPFDIALKKREPRGDRMWQVGTMYFTYNNRVLDFLKEWCDVANSEEHSDELALDKLWKSNHKVIRAITVGELPAAYFQMLKIAAPDIHKNTIICHRASRDVSKMDFIQRRAKTLT